jgi:sigma-B regulation protein RsbU (phosphoserine phosphatase)
MKESHQRLVYLTLAIILIPLKIAINVVFYSLGIFPGMESSVVNLGISIILVYSVYKIYLLYFNSREEIAPEEVNNRYLKELYNSNILLIILILSEVFVSIVTRSENLPDSYFNLILNELIFTYSIFTFIYVTFFVVRWFNIRRYKRTQKLLNILFGLAASLFILSAFSLYADSQLRIITSGMENFIIVISIIITLMLASKNQWINSMVRGEKIRLFWSSLFGIFLLMILLIQSADSDSRYFSAIGVYLPAFGSMIDLFLFILLAYEARVFLAVLFSLPNSGYVDRKAGEISSLTFLNKFVAESVNKESDYLIETVTKLARNACAAAFAWTEIYENGEVKIYSAINIDKKLLDRNHDNGLLKDLFCAFDKTTLVKSVPDDSRLYFIADYVPPLRSMIIVPIYSDNERTGTLIVGDNDEYSFEFDDVKVMSAFSDNIRIALENARLMRESIEKERLRRELLVAKEIQQKLLPVDLPEAEGYTLAAYSLPATEVGGDYYDVIELKSGKKCVLIGDVSGKGISAAFYMAQLKGIVMSARTECDSPAELLSKINSVLFGKIDRQVFVTMCAVSIEDDSGKINFARAGHMPLIEFNGSLVEKHIPGGAGIGIMKPKMFDSALQEKEIILEPGATAFIFTDGVNELRNELNKELGMDRLIEIISENNCNSAMEIISHIKQKLDEFAHENSVQHDDITMAVIKRNI